MEKSKNSTPSPKGNVSEDVMEKISAYSLRPLSPEEVYVFSVILCDNDIDRDGERFAVETLEELGKLFVGVSGVFDHQWSARGQTARIYRTEVVHEEGTLTQDGQPYCYLKGYAYMMRTEDNAGLIAEIDGGIKREVSVGCAVERVECSICGEDMNASQRCGHQRGQEYDGQLCTGILLGATDAYEWSFVAVPAQKKAGVVKRAKLREKLEREAEIGRTYLERLRGEVVRLACLVQPEADRDLMERVARRLDWEELDGLKKLYQAQADRRFIPQSQLWQGEDRPEDRRGDSAFLI